MDLQAETQIKSAIDLYGKMIVKVCKYEDKVVMFFADKSYVVIKSRVYLEQLETYILSDNYHEESLYELFKLGFITKEEMNIQVEKNKKLQDKYNEQEEIAQLKLLKQKYPSIK